MAIQLDSTNGITNVTWTSTTRPASPVDGQMGFNTQTNSLEVYDSGTTSWLSAGAGVLGSNNSWTGTNTFAAAVALGASATATTPAQFDNDTSVATTAFVQRALGSFSGVASSIFNTTTTLTAADAGKFIPLGGTTGVAILPAASSVPIGTTFTFINFANLPKINTQGGDTLLNAAAALITLPLTMGGRETLQIVSTSSSSWSVVTSAWNYAATTTGSVTGNGYQVLPSGLIIQWGQFLTSNANYTSPTFPIAFPNAFLQCVVTATGGVNSDNNICVVGTGTTTGVPIAAISPAAVYKAVTVRYITIGY